MLNAKEAREITNKNKAEKYNIYRERVDYRVGPFVTICWNC